MSTLPFEIVWEPYVLLSLFWAVAVIIAFNTAYLLFVLDRRRSSVTRARIVMTVIVGSLVVVGTYAEALAAKDFALRDCLLLAFVAAHGWMAEALFDSVVSAASRSLPTPG